MKRLFLLIGPIGSGKSTLLSRVKKEFSIEHIEYVSADYYFDVRYAYLGSEFYNRNANAKRYAYKMLEQCISNQSDVIWETVVAKKDKIDLIKDFIAAGYYITCIYVSVNDVHICQHRVEQRQLKRGFEIPQSKVIKKYYSSYKYLSLISDMVDELWIIDNSIDRDSKEFIKMEKLKNIRMVAIDCDGTLLTSKKEITDESLAAIEKLKKMGIGIVLATARPFYRIKKYINAANLLSDSDYSILFNGGMVANNRTGEIEYSNPLTASEISYLLDLSEQYNEKVFLYTVDGILASYFDEEYVKRNKDVNYEVTDLRSIDFEKVQIFKFVFVNKPEEIVELKKKLPSKLYEQYEATSSVPQFVEVVKKNVTKAEALLRLASKCGVSINDIMVFGDEENDLSMMKIAGFSICMANGSEEVKETADFVTLTNDDDGFAYAIKMLL